METAKRMWGTEYEIVVTTHLNTDNIHNHFVVNSVSFKDGLKYAEGMSDSKIEKVLNKLPKTEDHKNN